MIKTNERDLLDAIQHADINGDQEWTLNDFKISYLGSIPISTLNEFDDPDSWLDIFEGGFKGMTVEDRFEELSDFRGEEWANRSKKWLIDGIPPIVIITSPMTTDTDQYTQIGDGRGRINFANAFDINEIGAFHMKWKGYEKASVLNREMRAMYCQKQLFKKAADTSDLIKINLSKLPKDNLDDANPREFYSRLKEEALDGPIFNRYILSRIRDFPDSGVPNDKKQFIRYLADRYLKRDAFGDDIIFPGDLTYIKDYINANGLNNSLSLDELADASDKWHEQFGRGNDTLISGDPVIYSFEDGFTIVQVKSENLQAEGEAMGHCVGEYCEEVDDEVLMIYSLRDPSGSPHVTIEVSQNGHVEQIKGKQNVPPIGEYQPYIREWLKQSGFNYKNTSDYTHMLSAEELSEYASSENSYYKELAAKHPNTDLKDLKTLVEVRSESQNSMQTLIILARNPNIDEEIQNELVQLDYEDINLALLENKSVTEQVILNMLKRDNSYLVKRNMLTGRSQFFPKLMEALSYDETIYIRESIGHTVALLPILERLSIDKEKNVRIAVAENENASLNILTRLAKDPEVTVRLQVAHNTNISQEIMESLTIDNSEVVRENLAVSKQTSSDILSDLSIDEDVMVRYRVAQNNNTSKRTLIFLADDTESRVRYALARNPNMPKEVEYRLAQDIKSGVRQGIAARKDLDDETIRVLLRDEDEGVQRRLKLPPGFKSKHDAISRAYSFHSSLMK